MMSILAAAATATFLAATPYELLPTGPDSGFPPEGWSLVNVEDEKGEVRFLMADEGGWEVILFVTERGPGDTAYALSAGHSLNYRVEKVPEGKDPNSFPPNVEALVEAAAEALVAGEGEGANRASVVAGGGQVASGGVAGAGAGASGGVAGAGAGASGGTAGVGAEGVGLGAGGCAERLLGGSPGRVPELAPGFRFRAVSTAADRIRFRFDHPYSGRLDVWIAPRSAGHKGYADTDYLTIWYDVDEAYPEGAEARGHLDTFLEEVVAVVRRSDSGEWVGGGEPGDTGGTHARAGESSGSGHIPAGESSGPRHVRPGESSESGRARAGDGTNPGTEDRAWLAGRPVDQAAAAVAFFALLLSVISLWKVVGPLRRILAGCGRAELAVVLAAVAAGGIRLVLVPLAPVKVGMVFPMLDEALRLEGLPRYGAGGAVLVHLIFRFLNVHLEELLRFNSMLALAVPLLGAAAVRRLFPVAGTAGFSALYLALTPLFLRDGNTESLLVPGFFLVLIGLHLLLEFVDEGAWGWGAAALPSLAAAASMRPELVVLVIVLPALLWRRTKERKRLAVVAVSLCLLLVPGAMVVLGATGRDLADGNLAVGRLNPGFVLRNLAVLNVLVAPGFFPLSTALLGLAGLGFAVRGRAGRGIALALAGITMGWLVFLAVDLNEESMLRLEVPAAMIWSVLAAVGSAALVGRGRTVAARMGIGAGIVAAFVVSSVPGVGVLFEPTNSQEDSRVFHAAMERLPPGRVRLVVLTADDAPELAIKDPGAVGKEPPPGHVPVHRQLPLYRLRALRPDVQVVSVSRFRAGVERDSRTFFYLGASCYAYRDAGGNEDWGVPSDPPPSLHPACRHVLARYRVSPFFLERVPNRMEVAPAFHWYPESLKGMTLGLLELEAASPSGRPQDPWASVGDACNREARILVVAGALDRAVDLLDRCERLFPDSLTVAEHLSSALYLRGTRQDDREDLEGAFHRLTRVAQGDLGRPQVLSRLGSIYFFYSKFRTDAEMEAELDARLQADPDDIVGLYLKGLFLFYARRDYAASEFFFLKVLERKQDEPRVFVYLALDAFYRGRQEEAEVWIKRGVDLAPAIEDPDVYYVRSIIVRTRDLAQAGNDIERYLELTEGPDRVRHPTKQAWLRKELENLRAGRPSDWWRSREPTEPWVEGGVR